MIASSTCAATEASRRYRIPTARPASSNACTYVFFGAVETFAQALLHTRSDPDMLIIRMRHVPFMDITGIQTLKEVVRTLRKRGVTVLLCEANQRVHSKLVTAGVLASATDESYSASLASALQRIGVLPAADFNQWAPSPPA